MSDSTEDLPCCWFDTLIRSAYPRSAGMTLAAVQAMTEQETFTRAQVAYLVAVALELGAQARTAGDAAELEASREANFAPRPTREARIAARVAAMGEQDEILQLRTQGYVREPWTGGEDAAVAALERFMWDEDRPDPVVPPGRLYVRTEHGVLVWDERKMAGR